MPAHGERRFDRIEAALLRKREPEEPPIPVAEGDTVELAPRLRAVAHAVVERALGRARRVLRLCTVLHHCLGSFSRFHRSKNPRRRSFCLRIASNLSALLALAPSRAARCVGALMSPLTARPLVAHSLPHGGTDAKPRQVLPRRISRPGQRGVDSSG